MIGMLAPPARKHLGTQVFASLLSIVALTYSARAQSGPAVEKLGQAAAAYRQGQHQQCLKDLTGLKEGSLKNPDVLLLLKGQCQFYSGQAKLARQTFGRLAKHYRDSPHAILARFRSADCDWKTGKRGAAVQTYAQLERGPKEPRADRALALYRRAVHAFNSGQNRKGQALWFRLRTAHPAHPLATESPPQGRAGEHKLKQSLLLGQALNKAKRWQEALDVLDQAPEPRRKKDQFALALAAGRVLFDMRFHYDQAARLLLGARKRAPSARQAEEAWFFGSRALGRADRDGEAIASHLAMVAKYPKGKYADRALYYAGWLEQNQGQCEKAQTLFARLSKEYPKSKWNKEAAWFSSWCHLRHKKWKEAISALRPQLKQRGYRFGGRAHYWTAMAHRAMGQDKIAQKLFHKIIARYPLTWYSRLARARLGKQAPAEAKLPRSPKAQTVDDPLFERVAELIRADLPGPASILLRREEKSFLGHHPGRAGRLAIMDVYRRAGDFNRPWFLSLVRERSALEHLPTQQTLPVWKHAYPPCRRELLEAHIKDDPTLVLLLQGIMRTESGFDPQALSVADARGLMQMIPPTAVEVARRLKIADYSDDALFDPQLNIRTAAWYIGGLVAKFKRQWPLAAGAYNGGPPNMMSWCKKSQDMELDAFVESIPFTESRRYAKRVFSALVRYAWLEGKAIPQLKLKMDPEYLPREPNF